MHALNVNVPQIKAAAQRTCRVRGANETKRM
jgi:hypothetical protein